MCWFCGVGSADNVLRAPGSKFQRLNLKMSSKRAREYSTPTKEELPTVPLESVGTGFYFFTLSDCYFWWEVPCHALIVGCAFLHRNGGRFLEGLPSHGLPLGEERKKIFSHSSASAKRSARSCVSPKHMPSAAWKRSRVRLPLPLGYCLRPIYSFHLGSRVH